MEYNTNDKTHDMYMGKCTDGTQIQQIYNKIRERRLNLKTLPSSLPAGTSGWYVTTTITNNITSTVLKYQDSDTTYNYEIDIKINTGEHEATSLWYRYRSTEPTEICKENPVEDCSCIAILKTDKSGTTASDTVLPDTILNNALATVPIIEEHDSQILRLCAKLRERAISITNLPTSLTADQVGWYSTTTIDTTTGVTYNVIKYQDFKSSTSYDYEITIRYGSTGTSCNTNPIANCNCITIAKTDKTGSTAPDNILPETVIYNAQKTLPIAHVCHIDEDEIFAKMSKMKFDTSKIPFVADVTTITQDGWYKTTIAGRDVIIYIEKSDPNHNYKIEIEEKEHDNKEVSTCVNVTTEVTDKQGNTVVGGIIPTDVQARATSTIPTTCGTGLWDSCTAGVQNKYIIGGGVAALTLLYILTRRE